MSGWAKVKLGEVATILSGGTPSKARAEFWNGDIPWVSPKDMKSECIEDTEDRITKQAVVQSATKIVGPNSVLAVVRSGILAHTFPVATLAREVSFNQDIQAITPRSDRLLPAFLYWMLKARENEILRIGVKRGATVHSLANGFLEALPFSLPPVVEQRRIVALLEQAEQIRRRADAARAKAHAIKQAVFFETFGDLATNPKGWPVCTLADVGEIASGLTKGRKLKDRATVMAPYLRVANVQDGFLDLTEIKTIEATSADLEKCALLPGDLLMTEGGDPDKLGRCAIWSGEIDGCLHQNHIFRVRVQEPLTPEYAAAFIQSDTGKAYFLRVAKRTTGIATINKTQLGGFSMVIPPASLQAIYCDRLRGAEAIFDRLKRAARKAEALAAAMSAEMFQVGVIEGRGQATVVRIEGAAIARAAAE